MSYRSTRTDRLLRELESDAVVPERYSRLSLVGRSEPVLVLVSFAVIAIVGSPLLCELTRAPASR